MHQNLIDIEELAEDLGNRFLSRGKVNLEKIAKSKRINFIKKSYDNYFLGQLVHCSKKFYIILNTDLLSNSESGRLRFTIAHELGHYFIDEHRTKLAKGISLSYKGELSGQECKNIEKQANHFASHLLMPKTSFCKLAKKKGLGLEAILFLKSRFDVSIYAATKHYIHLDVSPSIMIKWNSDFTYHYASYSKSFSEIMGVKGSPPIKYQTNYVQALASLAEQEFLGYYEDVTLLSRWISTITPNSAKDIVGLEQTIKLGEFGGITLLTFV